MKKSIKGLVATLVIAAGALSGCGGGGDSSTGPIAPPPSGQLAAAIAAAAAIPANDSSTSTSSAFSVLQANGVPAVVVNGPPVVNFTVFSDGKVKTGLTLSNVTFIIAKLVPGTNGNIDQWQSYTYKIETTTAAPNDVGSAPGGKPVLASAVQATTDPKPATVANQLVYNSAGYYTYTFSTNITDPAVTNGVVFQPGYTHRVVIQLNYTNDAGQAVLVNPYYDVTFDADGRSVPVTDPNKTRIVSVPSECNGCHEKLSLHGGGRVDVQYCVMCHNPGTTDANSGNVLTMMTMAHKIHAGRLLASPGLASIGGEHYTIWITSVENGTEKVTENDFSEVGFPQDLRNCTVCHTGANPSTPQGDYWRKRPSKEACLTCHVSGAGSPFYTYHLPLAAQLVGPGANPTEIPNSDCAFCHRDGTSVSAERVHWNQNEENSALYKVTIESASYDASTRKVTIKYYVANPTQNDARYNLVTADCTVSGAAPVCSNQTQFGNLRFYLAYQNMIGQPTSVTEWTAYNNGGSGANVYLYKGANDGTNKYTIELPVPADTATQFAQGSARVVSIGQIKEPKLEVKTAQDPRPPVTPTVLINVVPQNTYADVALSGPLNPRRQVVSNEKCNVCHGALGATSGSNTLANAFHSGARNTVEACSVCHDQNRVSSSTAMTSGRALGENYSFKRMIHGIHGTSKRTYPFTHGNSVFGAFNKAGILTVDGFLAGFSGTPPATALFTPWQTTTVVPKDTAFPSSVTNYAAEVQYPGIGLNCNACHVNNSWQQDPGTVGSVVSKPLVSGTADPNPLNWRVITPKAASCTSCHDSERAIDHVVGVGGAAFGTATQGQSFQMLESCVDCHRVGLPYGVDKVHK